MTDDNERAPAPPAAPGGVSLTMTQLAIVAFIAHHGVEWNAMQPEDRMRFAAEVQAWERCVQAVLAAARGTGDGRLREAAKWLAEEAYDGGQVGVCRWCKDTTFAGEPEAHDPDFWGGS